MYILGFESSCDETAVSLVERGEQNRILGEKIKSQIDIHAKYGGVVPEIASRNHFEVIDILCQELLEECKIKLEQIDGIAFTQGPGLIGSLLNALVFAKTLAYTLNLPLIPVNHITAHIEAAFINNKAIEYPLLALVVSGGHTSIYFQEEKFNNKIVAKTRDDAIGEALDKAARYFNLPYPGGPVLDKLWGKGEYDKELAFNKPKFRDETIDFSFSGYKTGIINRAIKFDIKLNSDRYHNLIRTFMEDTFDYLLYNCQKATELYPAQSFVVAGGVSRNTLLRKKFSKKIKEKLYFPLPQHCTDNASMIAWLGSEKLIKFGDKKFRNYEINSFSRNS